MASKQKKNLIVSRLLCVVIGILLLASSVQAQETRTGWIDAAPFGGDCGLITNAKIDALRCLQTVTINGRTAGLSYKYNGSTWVVADGGSGSIGSLNGLSGTTQTFANDTNVTISSASTTHTLGWSGQLSLARGGTSASSASGARTALGLSIGTNVQAYSDNLAALASESGTGLYKITGAGTGDAVGFAGVVDLFASGSCSGFLKSDGTCSAGTVTEADPIVGAITGLVKANGAGSITAAVAGTDYQGVDSDLTAIAALTTTSYGRSVLTLADAAALRTLGGLVIGTNVQAQDSELAALAGLTSAANKCPNFSGSGTAAIFDCTSYGRGLLNVADEAAFKALVNLEIGTDVQAQNANLAAIAGLTSAADTLGYFTGSGAASITTLTTFARSLLDDANASAGRATLGVIIGTDVQAQDAELAAIAGLTSAANKLAYFTGSGTAALADLTSFGRSLIDDADASAGRTTLGVVIGTNVQAFDAELSAIAGLTSAANKLPYFTGSGTAAVTDFTAYGRLIAAVADEAAFKALVNLEIGTDVQAYDADLTTLATQTAADLISGKSHQGIDAGSTDAYAACPASLAQAGALTDGGWVNLRVNTVNTGNATFDGCTYGAKNIVKNVGGLAQTLADADLRAGATYTLVYKSATTVWEVQSILGNAVSATGDVTAASNFGTDNSCLRADGTSKGAQGTSTNCTISDAGAQVLASSLTATAGVFGTVSSKSVGITPGAAVSGDRVATYNYNSDQNLAAKGTLVTNNLAYSDSSEVLQDSGVSRFLSVGWDAGSLTPDGTLCTDPAKTTINSGPAVPTFVCADNNSSIFDGELVLPRAITTATFTLTVNDVDSSSQHFAGGFKAQCRGTGTTVNSTWGTAQTVDITMPTANNNVTGTTAALTPNGTCGANATLFWRFTVDATTNTDDGDARVINVKMDQVS